MGTFIADLTTAAGISSMVTMQQAMLLAVIVIPLGFAAYRVMTGGIRRIRGN